MSRDTAMIVAGFREAMGGSLATDTEIEVTVDRIGYHGREWVTLRAAAPLRKPVEQRDVDGLGLFDAHRSPGLL